MFEDLVSKVLPALLGRYVSFQKDQLTINIWNQEIILVDVELILEAFDYLQLPFALKKGRIGKLSVRIPWKTLGWGAIIIAIEDWSSDSLDKRELDGKLAKLKAIELAKISRRITDNQTGQSLLSYILAKILDNIQVSIRNVHITYADDYKDQGNFMFGLEFSSLSIQTDPKKQSFAMSLMAMSRQDEVNKTVEISNVGIYCHHLDEQQGSCDIGGLTETNFSFSHGLTHPRDTYLINPFNVTIFVLANKTGKLDGAPRYNITVELTALILSIDEIQIQQILNLCDYFSICALRTKYGRYRPSQSSLSKRHKGWQRMWWHYAQRSVLADGLPSEICQFLQNEIGAFAERTGSPRTDDQSAGAGQGWLKWLSRGMLGAGGTADTNSFADVSDDIIKDIYEGTEFHPISSAENHLTKENRYSLFVRLSFSEILVSITSRQVLHTYITGTSTKFGMKLVDAMFAGLGVECKIWDDSTTILAWLDSLEIINPLNENKVLLAEKCSTGDGLGTPVISVQVDFPKSNHGPEASTRVVIQEFSAIYEPVFTYNLMHIYDLFSSFQFQHDRVLSSLNRFDSFGARLLSKLKYTSANRKKLLWDLRIHHFVVRLPSRNCGTEEIIMVFEAGDVSMQSKDTVRDASRTQESNSFLDYISKTLPSNFSDDLLIGFKLDDLYNHFEVKVLMSDKHDIASTFVKLDASIVFGLCIFLDEPVLKQLEVSFIVPFADMYFCQTLYSAFVNLCFYVKEADLIRNNTSDDTKSEPKKVALNMFASLKLAKLSLRVDLEDHHEGSSAITVCVGDVDIRYAIQELSEIWVLVKMVQITFNNLKEELNSCVLCLSGNCKMCVNLTGCPESSTSDACLKLHYRTLKYEDQMHHVYQLNLNDVDLHVIPSVFGQIRRFLNSLDAAYPDGTNVVFSEPDLGSMKLGAANTKFPKFALSSFCGVDSTLFAGIPVDHFPFVRMDFISGYQASGGSCSKSKCNGTSDLNCYCAQGPASNSLCKTKHSNCSSNSSKNSMNASLTVLDLSLVSVRVHFHESCGILATLSVPESIATLSLSDASSWDFLLSAKDIMLSSSWTSPSVHELLWGRSSHGNANILNIHIKKDFPALSTELLAMFIGFFLLDDWTPLPEGHHSVENHNLESSGESLDSMTYTFELCDCVVLLPVENQDLLGLRLGVPYFFGEFVSTGSTVEFANRIPKEFFSSECMVSSRVDIISLCAVKASISLLFPDDQANFILKLDENMPRRIQSLVEKLDAGIWIQIPCIELSCSEQSSLPTFIMSKISKCNLIAEDLYFVDGMEAVFAVTDELISIGKASKLYKGNALQFLEQRILNEETPGPNDSINITVSVSDLVIFFCHSKDKGLALEKIANANMKFDVSAVLVSEKPERIDMDIVSLALQSSDSHTLVSIMSDGSLSPVFIKFAKHDGRDEILMSIPSFEVWLYLVDWDIIINHFHSYARKEESSSPVVHSAALPCSSDSPMPSFPETDCGSLDDSKLLVTCENIAGVVHVPIWQKTENCASNVMPGTYGSCIMQATSHHFADDIQSPESKNCKFITLMFNSKHFVVSLLGDSRMNFRCDLDRMKIILEMIQGDRGTSVPFMHISKAKAAGYIYQPEGNPLHLSVDLQAEYMDVGFSHQIFSFCRSMELKFPVSSSSASSFYSVTFKVGLRKGSILLNDGRWGSHGPVIETLVKNLLVQFSQSDQIEVSAFVDLLVNYNNIDKLNVIRKCANHALDISPSTEVWLNSSNQLNLNISEPLIEAVLRLGQMITNSLNPVSEGGLREDLGILRLSRDDVHTRRYAPYILANDTSLPFKFRVYRGAVNSDDIDSFSVIDENSVPAGYAVPIYVEEALDEFFFQHREARSSEHLIEKRMSAVSHYMISIEFDATSGSSKPMSMDLVGIYFFEVNFSSSKKPLSEESWEVFASNRKGSHESGLIVPVVLDVSLHNYSKLIRVYSTVKLYNATSMPLELRFDIPFGVSSKVLGPILPDKEFPLPVHLSEAGQIRWHPVGRTYLWSETHSLSSLLSHESRVGFMKSSVCYPSHPSNDPFRCCVSVEEYSIPTSSSTQKGHYCTEHLDVQPNYGNPIPKASKQISARKHFIRKVRLSTPLLIKNYLPVCISLTIDNGGVANEVSLKEVSFASIFFVDPSNDLGITFHIQDYRSLAIKFPRVESFSTAAKSNGPKFSLTETITFYSNELNCPLNVTLEKAMDANSDLLLTITESSYERNGSTLVIPSSFELDGQTRHLLGKNGLSLVSEDPPIQSVSFWRLKSFAKKIPQLDFADGCSSYSNRTAANNTNDAPKECNKEAKAYMFAPSGHTPATELLVKLNASVPNSGTETTRRDWSSPFLLVPASGSMNATIPQSSSSGAFLVAATSIPVSTELFGRTRAIAFQPSNDLFYRQKGTRFSKHLSSGQHSFLHWSDTERELLVSIRFDGPGWQWSGSFFPDQLGDVQLKMRNSASGVSNMIRVEVQNADIDVHSNKFAGRNNSNTGTILILLSDDKTGFVPYRVDNFSMEKCESLETIVYPYTSCQYAWDEPCYPHRLTVEKAERKFCISVHAEGAIKVLGVIDSNCHNMDKRETNLLGSRERKDADQKQELELNFSDVFKIHLPFIGLSLISSLSQELLFASARETTIVAMQSLDQQQITIEMQSMQIDNQFSDSPYPVMLSFEGSHKGKNMNFFKSRDTKVRSPNENSSPEPILRLAAAKWRSNDAPFVSYQCINMSIAPFHLELEERLVFSMIDFIRSVSTRIHLGQLDRSFDLGILDGATDIFGRYEKISKRISGKPQSSCMVEAQQDQLLPSVVPIGAPWQQIHLLARKQKKVYIELFELTPIKLTFSFTSTPWLNRNESSSDPSTSFNNSTAIQRGLMALIDVEGVPVHLGEIVVENLMASWQSIQDILVRHYSRQLLHEVYKVFGSAGVIGNPMGFARNVGFGLKDFVSASRRGILQGLVAFTYDEQAASKMDERERQLSLHGEGVLNGFLEGLTGLLQSPIRGAEKHGLPGVISGIAMGTAGLVARPMASILEATGRTAQSIRNRSNPHESNRLRVRFPRPVARDRPLFPYSWEEAIGISLLFQADGGKLREETFVMCKTLREPGKFLVLTEKLLLLVSSPYLVDLGSPQFVGVPPDPQWAIETEMSLKSIVHLDRAQEIVNIVGSNGETSPRDKRGSIRNRGASSAFIPLFHFSVEMPNIEDAEGTLQVLLALIEKGKARRWDKNIIHRSNIY
uniref:C2 domain-containing protein n=1 Tax=Oryza punctata TaxID=4537 RepID=A0A0E0LQM8_ORYPU